MPQISPLYWPLIFLALAYFISTTNASIYSAKLPGPAPTNYCLIATNNELNW